jgi:hypothetical protein
MSRYPSILLKCCRMLPKHRYDGFHGTQKFKLFINSNKDQFSGSSLSFGVPSTSEIREFEIGEMVEACWFEIADDSTWGFIESGQGVNPGLSEGS